MQQNNPKIQRLIDKEIDRLVKEEFIYFLLEKWMISSGEHKNEKYSLKDRPYMKGIIQDDFPFQVKLKSAQSGVSEEEVAKAIHRVLKKKGNLLYTFPAGEQMQQFVDARVRTAVLNNPYLAKFVTGSLNLKKFSLNNNELYFRGVQKRRQIISVDVSSLFADEIDAYEDDQVIYTLNKRLGAAKDPYKSYFSTPSFHGAGISLYYYGSESQRERGSDQRVWTIQCEHCGQWNEDLLWFENIRDLNEKNIKFNFYEPDVIVICRYCKKPLDRLSSRAEWVATLTKNSDYCHGHHISKLFTPTGNLNQMMLDSNDPLKEQEFYNSDLGLPYEPKGSRLTDDVINNCRGTHTIWIQNRERVKTFGGFDIGAKIHAVASVIENDNRPRIVNVSELDSWDDLPNYFSDMRISTAVIDANPDKDEAIEFQKDHEGVWLAYFNQQLETTPEKYKLNWDDQIIFIHRTLMMMTVSDLFYEKDIILPISIQQVRDFYEHLKSPIQAKKQDTKGNWISFYPKTRAADHYYFAVLYNIMATMLKSTSGRVKRAKMVG